MRTREQWSKDEQESRRKEIKEGLASGKLVKIGHRIVPRGVDDDKDEWDEIFERLEKIEARLAKLECAK